MILDGFKLSKNFLDELVEVNETKLKELEEDIKILSYLKDTLKSNYAKTQIKELVDSLSTIHSVMMEEMIFIQRYEATYNE